MSRVEFLIRVLGGLLRQAPAPSASPVSLQTALVLQQIGRELPFSPQAAAASERLIAYAVNLELAFEERRDVEAARAEALAAFSRFVELLEAPRDG